jgi:hypothetical protein
MKSFVIVQYLTLPVIVGTLVREACVFITEPEHDRFYQPVVPARLAQRRQLIFIDIELQASILNRLLRDAVRR